MLEPSALAVGLSNADSGVLAVAITAIVNILFLGFIYGKLVTKLEGVTEELKGHAQRAAITDQDHSTQLRDHSQRITRLETKVIG